MGHLQDKLLTPAVRPLVLADCEALLAQEVAGKGGLGGLAIKTVFGVVKKVRPGITRELIDRLLDAFVAELDPFYLQATEANLGFVAYLPQQANQVANALLSITDRRAQQSSHQLLKSSYDKLRPTAIKHVEAAVPGIARVVVGHL